MLAVPCVIWMGVSRLLSSLFGLPYTLQTNKIFWTWFLGNWFFSFWKPLFFATLGDLWPWSYRGLDPFSLPLFASPFYCLYCFYFWTDFLSILDITAPSNKHWLTILYLFLWKTLNASSAWLNHRTIRSCYTVWTCNF